MALAAVEALGLLLKDNETEFPVRIKWPNDLFYLRLHKLGGVLVNASVHADELRLVFGHPLVLTRFVSCNGMALEGCGLNVANSLPTVCVNDLADAKLGVEEVGCGRPLRALASKWGWYQVIAELLNSLEVLVVQFQEGGSARILPLYHRYWLHKSAPPPIPGFGTER